MISPVRDDLSTLTLHIVSHSHSGQCQSGRLKTSCVILQCHMVTSGRLLHWCPKSHSDEWAMIFTSLAWGIFLLSNSRISVSRGTAIESQLPLPVMGVANSDSVMIALRQLKIGHVTNWENVSRISPLRVTLTLPLKPIAWTVSYLNNCVCSTALPSNRDTMHWLCLILFEFILI